MATTTPPSPAKTPIRVFVFGALAELLFGYDLGIISVALLSIDKTFPMNATTEGFVVSSLLLGAAVGVTFAGRLSDRIGRKPVLYLTSGIFIVGGVMAAFATGLGMLVIGRALMGLGVGASSSVVTVYLVETAHTRHRGKVGSLGQLMVVLGILLAYLVGYALAAADAWRLMLGASVVPALVLAVGLISLPETPRWLVSRGRRDEARRSLHRLGYGDSTESTLEELQYAYDVAARQNVQRLRTVLRNMAARGMRRNTIVACMLAVLVQLVGTNSIIYYAPSALVDAGLTESAAVFANLGVGTANVLFTILGLFLVDRMPRRTLLTAGLGAMLTAMTFLSLISLVEFPTSTATGWLTLAGMVVFLAGFAVSWGLLTRVVVSELFPSSIRGSATGLVLVLNWLANFVVGQTFPALLEFSTTVAYGIFAGVAVIAMMFVQRLLPETGAGRSLEQIQAATGPTNGTSTVDTGSSGRFGENR